MPTSLLQQLEVCETAVRRWEPRVKALVDWDPDRAQRNLKSSASGPLQGWAIGVKDIIDLEGQPTGCNAPFIRFPAASANAAVVQRFIDLGAFVFSKTVTTTFAFFDPGPTRNPWNLEHTPGGSSSGSAAAVACGMVRLALGSQTVGSVNRPASFCGVVGFKPTYGRLPITGVFPFAPSVDTLGYFTRSVADAQQALDGLVGPPDDPVAADPPRVGVAESLYVDPADEEMLQALGQVARQLEAAGLPVHQVQLPASCQPAQDHHWSLVAAEAAFSHQQLYYDHSDKYPSKLKELILRGRTVSSSQMESIQSHRAELRAELDAFLENFDVLLTPSAPGAAPAGIGATGDPRCNLLSTYTGFPTLTLPARLSKAGLPLGIQLVGRPGRDHPLLSAGRSIEEILAFRPLDAS